MLPPSPPSPQLAHSNPLLFATPHSHTRICSCAFADFAAKIQPIFFSLNPFSQQIRGKGEMAAVVGARALMWSGSPAACVRQRVMSRCVGLSSSSSSLSPSKLLGRRAHLNAFRLSPKSARHLHFNGPRGVSAAASMSTGSAESVANNPGYCDTPDAVTRNYFVQQTMYRIKDPKKSLEFYSRVLGMTLLKRLDFEEAKFSLYFLGYEDPASVPNDSTERTAFLFKCRATLELTHNWGTESDPDFKGYHTGNSDPRGYGHIGITVNDVYEACERFEKMGVEFAKRPDDGRMKGLAFIKDPDGYWIEIFSVRSMSGLIK